MARLVPRVCSDPGHSSRGGALTTIIMWPQPSAAPTPYSYQYGQHPRIGHASGPVLELSSVLCPHIPSQRRGAAAHDATTLFDSGVRPREGLTRRSAARSIRIDTNSAGLRRRAAGEAPCSGAVFTPA